MSKVIDWNRTYKGALRGKRGTYNSFKEQLQKAREKEEQHDLRKAQFAKIEPQLKKSLLVHMLTQTPIKVLAPIQYFGEGLAKSGFEMETVQKVIPVGTELTFQRTDKSMGQWIFKSSEGNDVEIYTSPVVMIPGGRGVPQQVPNPGYWGLLTSTNIYSDIVNKDGTETK